VKTTFFHTGLTVTDLDQAVNFFGEVMGLTVSSQRELTGDYLAHMLDYHSALTARIAMLETDDNTFLELVEYHTENQELPSQHVGAHITVTGTPHFAFFIDDLSSFDAKCNPKHLTPLASEADTIPGGPFAGGKIRFYASKFGCLIEAIEKP